MIVQWNNGKLQEEVSAPSVGLTSEMLFELIGLEVFIISYAIQLTWEQRAKLLCEKLV